MLANSPYTQRSVAVEAMPQLANVRFVRATAIGAWTDDVLINWLLLSKIVDGAERLMTLEEHHEAKPEF